MTNEDFVELDLLAANLLVENKELKARVETLEAECNSLKNVIAGLEALVYGGRTM